uniref:(northern house mosquito) hypothetical protein n=1 Tax=Culex pipiens TaxID=7175 RepID=A0A8D8L818_CULPI
MEQMRRRELGKKGLAKNESTKSNYKEICPHLGIAENRFAGEVEMKKQREKKDYIYILTAKQNYRNRRKEVRGHLAFTALHCWQHRNLKKDKQARPQYRVFISCCYAKCLFTEFEQL